MGFGVGFRVAPGVRLRATRRGPRVSLGPRIARVHLGGGVPAVSAGTGPVTVWQTLSGGGHAAPEPRAQDRKAAEWATVRDHLDRLTSAHRRPVTRATRPLAPPVAEVRRRDVRRALRNDHLAGIPWWRLGARLKARRRADDLLDDEVARGREAAAREAAEAQADADAWWARLLANDPEVVTGKLEAALVDHAMPATVAAVEGDTAHLVIPVLPVDELIGPREPRWTEAGNLSLARMTKTRRHELYEAAISSAAIAVAAEAFAVGPGLAAVDLAVVCPLHLGGPAVLMLVELPREAVLPDDADRPVAGDLVSVAEAGRATLVRDKGGRIGALRPLSEEDPAVRELLEVLDTE